VTPGRRVGPYVLVEQLGRGGMGEVWLAEDVTGASGGAPRRVALKLLAPGSVDDPAARARFAREVQAARRVQGPTVAALLDADVEAARPWLATAHVAGPTLAEHVTAHGPLGDAPLRALGAALAEALVSIHGAGVIHRDLTPRNVVLGPDGPRVVDFGIARYAGADAVTDAGVRVGTPAWMAPERLARDEVASSGDVWSWGAVMAYAARGRPPVEGSGPEVVVHRVLEGDVDLTGVPAWLEPWVAAALAVAPGARPTPAELRAAMTGAPLPTTPPSAPSAPAGEVSPPDVPPTVPGRPTTSGDARTVPWPGVPWSGPTGRPRPIGPHAPAPGRRHPPASPRVRLLAAVVPLGVAVAVGMWAGLLVAILATAAVTLAAVALRLRREHLPEGSRPLVPTWALALAGPVMLGTALAVALGPLPGLAVLVALIVLFVVVGGDIG
jgi:serine/threonine protein kinase